MNKDYFVSINKKRLILLVSFFVLFVSAMQAEACATMCDCRPLHCCCVPKPKYHWYLDTNFGRSFDYAHNNINVVLNTPTPEFISFSSAGVPNPPFFTAALGYLWSQDKDTLPFWSFGVQYRYTVPLLITGIAHLTPPPENVPLGYLVAQQSFLLESKMDLYRWSHVMPYVKLGLGISLAGTDTPEFGNGRVAFAPIEITSSFSWSAGLGLDFPLKSDFWLTLGYSYDHFGDNKERFNSLSNPAVSLLVKNKQLHAQSVNFGIRYLFA